MRSATAVVFAYHNVGERCLRVLLAQRVDVALIVTHQDNPNETIFFKSVRTLADDYGIPVIAPDSPNTPELIERIADIAPDFIFSFYYRHMISPEILALAKRGGYNMHGSLLPRYRGRAPTNWAVLNGEKETGATLHAMVEKPDAGDIIWQSAVPILPDDTAQEVFDKVTVAAELTLHHALPALLMGTEPRTAQIPIPGHYFGGRKPEDGRIDLRASTHQIHNLIRAVAPPYPGAFIDLNDLRIYFDRSMVKRQPSREHERARARLRLVRDHFYLDCVDGGLLRILALRAFSRGATVAPETLLLPIDL